MLNLKNLMIISILYLLIGFSFANGVDDVLTINGLNLNVNSNNLNEIYALDNSPATCTITEVLESGMVVCDLNSSVDYFVVTSSNINIINNQGSPVNNIKLKIVNDTTFLFLENRFLSKEGLKINIKELEVASNKKLTFKRSVSKVATTVLTENISVIKVISNIEKIKLNYNSKFVIDFSNRYQKSLFSVIRNHFYLTSQNQVGYFFDELNAARENKFYLGSDSLDFSKTHIEISNDANFFITLNNSSSVEQLDSSFLLYSLNNNNDVTPWQYPTHNDCPKTLVTMILEDEEDEGPEEYPDYCSNEQQDEDEEGIDCGGSCEPCDLESSLSESDFEVEFQSCCGEDVFSCCDDSETEKKYLSLEYSLIGTILFKSVENNGVLEIFAYPQILSEGYKEGDSTYNLENSEKTSTIFYFEDYLGSNYPLTLNNFSSNIVYFSTCDDQLTKLENTDYNVCLFYNYSNNNNLPLTVDEISTLVPSKIRNFSRNTCNAVNESNSNYSTYLNMSNEKKANPVLFGNISKIFPKELITPNISNQKLLVYDNIQNNFLFNSNLLKKINNTQFYLYNNLIDSNYIGNKSLYAFDSNLSYENNLIRLVYPYKLYK
jgi:hypothetical protein